MEKQILYHGSNVIVEHPLVSIGRKDLDFDIIENNVYFCTEFFLKYKQI